MRKRDIINGPLLIDFLQFEKDDNGCLDVQSNYLFSWLKLSDKTCDSVFSNFEMVMEKLQPGRHIEDLEAELIRETYRYQLALRDGAVDSIVNDVVRKIRELECQLRQFKTDERNPAGQPPASRP